MESDKDGVVSLMDKGGTRQGDAWPVYKVPMSHVRGD